MEEEGHDWHAERAAVMHKATVRSTPGIRTDMALR